MARVWHDWPSTPARHRVAAIVCAPPTWGFRLERAKVRAGDGVQSQDMRMGCLKT